MGATTFRQRQAAAREAKASGPSRNAAARIAELERELARLQERFDNCDQSRLYWRGRCRVLGAPELQERAHG